MDDNCKAAGGHFNPFGVSNEYIFRKTRIRVGPDTFLASYQIPDIRLIYYAGYYSIKQKYSKKIDANLCNALGAQLTPLILLYMLNLG